MDKDRLTEEEGKEVEAEAERFFEGFKYQPRSERNEEKVIANEGEIMDKMKDSNLTKFVKQAKVFFRMVKAYNNKDYKTVPVSVIVSIVATLLYVFSPIDLIPDFLPVVGLLDDAAILAACVKSFDNEIKKFEEWEKIQKK